MKKKLNLCLLISFIIGVGYLVYSIAYWSGLGESSGAEAAGGAIALALVTPHYVCTGIAVIFNGLGLFLKKPAFALVGAILYAVALVLFPVYFMFVIVEMILSFVGYGQLKKANAEPAAIAEPVTGAESGE